MRFLIVTKQAKMIEARTEAEAESIAKAGGGSLVDEVEVESTMTLDDWADFKGEG